MAAPSDVRQREFGSTDWSIVRQLDGPDAELALAKLCEQYWQPLYAYVRSKVRDVHKAQDLTQGFFAHVMAKDSLRQAAPDRGRFRSFVLASLTNFMTNEYAAENAQRLGGQVRQVSLDFDDGDQHFSRATAESMTPERVFDRAWTLTLLDRVAERLRTEHEEAGGTERFEALKATLTSVGRGSMYDEIAEKLQVTEAAARQAASRLRKRYRELLRLEVGRTLEDNDDIEDEIRQMFASLG
ncbi:MAG: RNA polymerase sigma factor (sigma-70 family) [Planctomycetaceae bacterium]|jgi:RNA polymerase sigma factor (sigma-70 family)